MSWDYDLLKLILQTRMHSHPVGLDVWFFGRTLCLLPYFMCANSEGSDEAVRMRRLAWAFTGSLCDKYHNLLSWLKRPAENSSEYTLLLALCAVSLLNVSQLLTLPCTQ